MAINKVILLGNLGADPEVRVLADGTAVATFSLETTKKWKTKAGEQKEATEWHRVSLFGRLAEIAGEYLKKGSQTYVEGSLKTHRWSDNNGVERYSTSIQGSVLQLLGSAGGSGSTRPDTPPPPDAAPEDFFDDDIPF